MLILSDKLDLSSDDLSSARHMYNSTSSVDIDIWCNPRHIYRPNTYLTHAVFMNGGS